MGLMRDQRGASAVEFALVLPLLVVLIFGMMEASWLMAQQVEVRHAAREAARVAAVSRNDITDAAFGGPDGAFTYHDVVLQGCNAADLSLGTLEFSLASTGESVGDIATITAVSSYPGLTGLFSGVFPDELTTEVQIRLEQEKAWEDQVGLVCP